MSTELLSLYCPDCGVDRPAEIPPCPDGHDGACPDRACIDCGTALVLDAPLFAPAFSVPGRARRQAA